MSSVLAARVPARRAPVRVTLHPTLHAEWTKLRTLASTWWLLLAAVALTIAVGATVGAAFQCHPSACAPAASTSSSRSRPIPPIANQGRAGRSDATCDKRPSPAAGRPGFVGVVHTGPAQK